MGNLGLLDRTPTRVLRGNISILTYLHAEREAFKWVQKYISAFGGDPSKVMMYVPGIHGKYPFDAHTLRLAGVKALVRSRSPTICSQTAGTHRGCFARDSWSPDRLVL